MGAGTIAFRAGDGLALALRLGGGALGLEGEGCGRGGGGCVRWDGRQRRLHGRDPNRFVGRAAPVSPQRSGYRVLVAVLARTTRPIDLRRFEGPARTSRP